MQIISFPPTSAFQETLRAERSESAGVAGVSSAVEAALEEIQAKMWIENKAFLVRVSTTEAGCYD